MTVVEDILEEKEKLIDYLARYCEPLNSDDEWALDVQAFEAARAALPEELGITYTQLQEQLEPLRGEGASKQILPVWIWAALFYGTNAIEVERDNAELSKKIFGFNRVYNNKLFNLYHERNLVNSRRIIAPYVVLASAGPRLYHITDPLNTPAEVLAFFHLRAERELSGYAQPHPEKMELLEAEYPKQIWALSMMPSQTVDRAARGTRGWAFPVDDAPTFEDANNKHAVTYFEDGLTQDALRDGVMQLNPRTADVWRLVTATILESWEDGEKEPPRVWLDARQLCDVMGFKKHHKGGHRPENVSIAARALVDLERFYITIPYGAKQYPADANGKRAATTVQARARHRVLAVMAKEEIRQLFDTEWLALRWLVTAGDWVKAYPRNQFAPLFRALVELPGTYTPDLWAKAIGTELVWQYRQDEGKIKTQRVETMLRQACVLEEAWQEKNKKRARDNFEKALDSLLERGVCAAWEYNGTDIDRVEATQKGWFNYWLQARVVVKPPPEVTKVLEGVAKTKKQHRRLPKT